MKVRYENLDDYRHEIEDNIRAIDIYKDIIYSSSINIENNINNCNSKIACNKISNSNREIRIIRYNSKRSYYKYEIDKSAYISIREYNINRVYNCKWGAKLIRYDYSEVPRVVCVNIEHTYITTRDIR